jgi:hypothetical protein
VVAARANGVGILELVKPAGRKFGRLKENYKSMIEGYPAKCLWETPILFVDRRCLKF